MIWLTWRLQRVEIAVLALLVIGLTAVLAATRSDVQAVAEVTVCRMSGQNDPSACFYTPGALFDLVNIGLPWFNFLPLIAAVLLVLPIVQELESGTYRFAWTQSQPRARWIVAKLSAMVLLGLGFAAIIATIFTWWNEPNDPIFGRFDMDSYDFRGVLPVGHTLFAIALVAVTGVLLRRLIPTIAIAAALYVGLRLPFMLWIRPRLLEPLTIATTGPNDTLAPGTWEVSWHWQNSAGRSLSETQFFNICPPSVGITRDALDSCVVQNGLTRVVEYQPASNYWPLQLIEAGIYISVAVAMLGFAAWYLMRRFE